MTNNMRRIPLILMLGPQASGKSSFIKMNDLQNYTISADEKKLEQQYLKLHKYIYGKEYGE